CPTRRSSDLDQSGAYAWADTALVCPTLDHGSDVGRSAGASGDETQRQGNDRAIARTTPALLCLYTILTLTSQLLSEKGATGVRSTAWYRKTRLTFADAMAWVRRQLWDHSHFFTSPQETDTIKMPRPLFERFIDAVCYAA